LHHQRATAVEQLFDFIAIQKTLQRRYLRLGNFATFSLEDNATVKASMW
jgi:hypothetical protein